MLCLFDTFIHGHKSFKLKHKPCVNKVALLCLFVCFLIFTVYLLQCNAIKYLRGHQCAGRHLSEAGIVGAVPARPNFTC